MNASTPEGLSQPEKKPVTVVGFGPRQVAHGLATNADHFQPGATEWAGKSIERQE